MNLAPVFVTAIVFIVIYKIIELFARRKERMAIIEKMQNAGQPIEMPKMESFNFGKFTSLRIGALLTGLGFGLVLGYILSIVVAASANNVVEMYQVKGTIVGGCVLLFGGLGMLISYLIERKERKNL